MSEISIRNFAKAKGFHPKTLDRWLAWEGGDRDALKAFAAGLKIGENHLRDMMDWLEEIALRDRVRISEILNCDTISSVATDPRLGRADRLKRVKEQLRRMRFPRLAAIEDTIKQKIHNLKLPAEVCLGVPAGLEGGRIKVEFSAGSLAELQLFAEQLRSAATTQPAAEIFDLLSGWRIAEVASNPSGF